MDQLGSVATRNLVLPTTIPSSQFTENDPEVSSAQNKVASSWHQKLNTTPSNPCKVVERSPRVEVGVHVKTAKLDSQVVIDGEIGMSKKGLGITFKKLVVGFTAAVATNMSALP